MTRPAVVATTRRRTSAWWRVVGCVLLLTGLALAGCSDSSDDGGPNPGPDTDPAPGLAEQGGSDPAEEPIERPGIEGDFGEVAVTITAADGETCELCLLHADTSELRSQGLMQVTDPELGGFDGMLFDHGSPTSGAYWMKNTPMPLSIAYWDEAGSFVSSVDMEPCLDEPTRGCPTYPADGPFRFALEVPEGGLEEILAVEGSTLTVDGTACSLAAA